MKKFKISSLLLFFIVAAMLLCVVQAVGASDVIGFVPNSGEASVSKVDLLTYTEVARYYTAPRDNPDPYSWRTSRIAMDTGGNAWVINTGADAWATGAGSLQGSIVRIQADTTGLTTTNTDPKNPLTFGTDEAVQVFPVGESGDIPRSIAIDSEGYIWVGFYSGGQLMKYKYDEDALTPVAGPFNPAVEPVIRYYDMKFSPEGTLFISSRASTPTLTPIQTGIWTFNPTTTVFARETTWNSPYSILTADDGTVYATAYNNLLYIRDKVSGSWSPVTIDSSIQNRGMAFDSSGNVWIASTVGSSTFSGSVVYQYNPDTGVVGPNYALTSGTTPVGLGTDSDGNMWVVCRNDGQPYGWLEGFDPTAQTIVGAIQVGYRPYAYEFTTTGQIQELSALGDFVWYDVNRNGVQDDGELGIEDVTVELYDCEGTTPIATKTTDEDGYYLFDNLVPGSYKVKFMPDETYFFSPQDQGVDDEKDSDADPTTGMTECVTLAAAETNPTIDAGMYRVFDDETAETAWVDGTRYITKGNWATFTLYPGAGASVNIYAGQDLMIGTATFSAPDINNKIIIDIELSNGFVFADVQDNLKVQDYALDPYGNPSPGKFEWKATCTGNKGSITVPMNNLYGVHLDVGQWLINPNFM